MKRIYANTLLLLLCFTGLYTAAQTEYGDGSMRQSGFRYNSWNDVSSTWVPGDSSRYTYNSQGKLSMRQGESYVAAAWTPSYVLFSIYSATGNVLLSVDSFLTPSSYAYRSRSTYVYNVDDRMQIWTQSRWNTPLGAWGYNRRYQYSYTAAGKTNIVLSERFRSFSSSWVNDERYTYGYDGNNLTISYLAEKWDTVSNTWKNKSRADYVNDANGYRISESFQSWNGSGWDNTEKYEYTRDANGLVLTEKRSTWTAGAWVNTRLITQTYSAKGITLTYLDQVWNSGVGAWGNNSKFTQVLDGSGFPDNQTTELWDNVNSVWKSYYKYDFTFNSNGYLTFTHIDNWNTSLLTWKNVEEDFYWYEANPFAGINDEAADKLSLMVFPNPTADVVTVHSGNTLAEPMQAELLDATGRVVAQLGTQMPDGEQNYTYHLTGVAKGLYYLSVKAGNSTGSMPLLVK